MSKTIMVFNAAQLHTQPTKKSSSMNPFSNSVVNRNFIPPHERSDYLPIGQLSFNELAKVPEVLNAESVANQHVNNPHHQEGDSDLLLPPTIEW